MFMASSRPSGHLSGGKFTASHTTVIEAADAPARAAAQLECVSKVSLGLIKSLHNGPPLLKFLDEGPGCLLAKVRGHPLAPGDPGLHLGQRGGQSGHAVSVRRPLRPDAGLAARPVRRVLQAIQHLARLRDTAERLRPRGPDNPPRGSTPGRDSPG